jgi:hypothetical protein
MLCVRPLYVSAALVDTDIADGDSNMRYEFKSDSPGDCTAVRVFCVTVRATLIGYSL